MIFFCRRSGALKIFLRFAERVFAALRESFYTYTRELIRVIGIYKNYRPGMPKRSDKAFGSSGVV